MSTREVSQPLYQSSVPSSSKTRQGLSEALLQSRPHKEPSPLSSNRTGLLNFSFYSRPLVVARAAMLRYGEPALTRVSGGASSNMVNLAISKANSEITKAGNPKLRGKKKIREQELDISAKRTRAADVHNLSERRRRDRINEKITALQKLIPNCYKADKASILEDTIKYVKTVQLQLQMIYNQCRLTNPLMMTPAGMQLPKMPTMSPFSPMDLGMGKGTGLSYGMGMYDSSIVQHFPVPPMQEQFAPRLMGMQASTGFPMYGMLGQGLPVPMHVWPPAELPTKVSSITEISIPNTKLAASDLTLYLISEDQQHQSADI